MLVAGNVMLLGLLAVPPMFQLEKANWVLMLKGPCGVGNSKV